MAKQILQGRLVRWDDDRGFGFIRSGFIRSDNGQNDIFIHISAFPKNISHRPLVGDTIFYELGTDSNGRIRAVNARIAGVSIASSPRQNINNTRRNRNHENRNPLLTFVIAILILSFFVIIFVNKYQSVISNTGRSNFVNESINQTPVITTNSPTPLFAEPTQTQYSCSGKVYCDQMSSCEEALFYQTHCSGTKMDGDGDGRPCEDWCGY